MSSIEGSNDVTPGGWQITAVDSSGKEYGISSTADDYWYSDVENRAIPLLPGESSYLWFTFEVPAGLDLQSVQFRVAMPTLDASRQRDSVAGQTYPSGAAATAFPLRTAAVYSPRPC